MCARKTCNVLSSLRKGRPSQALITATEERLTERGSGFTFATAGELPKLNGDDTVDIEFFVDAGKRAYVRRICSLVMYDKTRLCVAKRQMEAGWASTAQIDLSKVRLERLGFKG